MIRWFFVKSSLNTSYYDNWSIFGHWKPFFKSLDKLPPSGLKPDPDLTLPHIDISACLFLTKVRRLSCASCPTDDLLQEGLCHLPKVQNRLITHHSSLWLLFLANYFLLIFFANYHLPHPFSFMQVHRSDQVFDDHPCHRLWGTWQRLHQQCLRFGMKSF